MTGEEGGSSSRQNASAMRGPYQVLSTSPPGFVGNGVRVQAFLPLEVLHRRSCCVVELDRIVARRRRDELLLMEHAQRDVDDRHTGREARGAQQSPSRLRIGVPQVGRLPVHELLLVVLDRRLRFLVVDRARVAGIALDPARVPLASPAGFPSSRTRPWPTPRSTKTRAGYHEGSVACPGIFRTGAGSGKLTTRFRILEVRAPWPTSRPTSPSIWTATSSKARRPAPSSASGCSRRAPAPAPSRSSSPTPT